MTVKDASLSATKRARKPCSEFGCTNLTRDKYCENHQEKAKEDVTKRNRLYNKVIRTPEIEGFYRTSEWRRVRVMALGRDNYLCQWCLKVGVLQAAQVVHHLIEVRDDWEKRFDIDNLECLCHACHNRHHKS